MNTPAQTTQQLPLGIWPVHTIIQFFKAVKTLSGFKEGKANDNNTVYIIYDPRCKYCHETFNLSRFIR